MSNTFQALSANSTTWATRQHYAVDTAALLLAGADPTSIDAKTPENVPVLQAVYSPRYYREALNWRERLVRAALIGELAVSIDGVPGNVGGYGDSGRWSTMPVNVVANLEKRYELRSRDIIFDIKREALAAWLATQGGPLPGWLESTSTKLPKHEEAAGWWYVVPLRWVFASGKAPGSTERQTLREIAKDMKERTDLSEAVAPDPNAERQQAAVRAALTEAPIDLHKALPTKSRNAAAGLFAYAAALAGVDATDYKAVTAALLEADIAPPPAEYLADIAELI